MPLLWRAHFMAVRGRQIDLLLKAINMRLGPIRLDNYQCCQITVAPLHVIQRKLQRTNFFKAT